MVEAAIRSAVTGKGVAVISIPADVTDHEATAETPLHTPITMGHLAPDPSSVQALVALMDEQGMPQSLDIARRLRAGGINTEVQMEPKKIGKQFQYAAKAGIRFVVLAGEDELARGVVAVKDLLREQQFEVSRDELASTLLVELEQSRAMV